MLDWVQNAVLKKSLIKFVTLLKAMEKCPVPSIFRLTYIVQGLTVRSEFFVKIPRVSYFSLLNVLISNGEINDIFLTGQVKKEPNMTRL